MQIALGADHGGFALKNVLRAHLRERGYEVQDMGAEILNSADDYPDIIVPVARWVAEAPGEHRAIVICRNGAGVSIVANKLPRVRSALATSSAMARSLRTDDDTNVLALAADYTDEATACTIADTWLTTPFSGAERHVRRIEKMNSLEPFI